MNARQFAAVTINLTPEEAVVLDNCLRRFAESDKLTLADASENQVFNNLLCLLERHGDRPLWPALNAAQAALRGDNAALVETCLICRQCQECLDPDDDLGPNHSFRSDSYFILLGDEAYRQGWLVNCAEGGFEILCPNCRSKLEK